MNEKDWDRDQPRQLLKAIVAHGTPRVPRETLMDALWPEERPDSAGKNFKTTLQRLRRSLEPRIDGEFGSSYVHVDDHSVNLDPELCEVDLDHFFLLVRKGEENEKAGDPKAALTAYNQALDLYRGDFLPEEVYAPWADMKREQMRHKYAEILARVCKLYETLGALKKAIECYKKAIEMDPLTEEFYQKLMTLYFNRGMLNDALRVYEECKKALTSGLKTAPDPMTIALYNKIREKLDSI